MIRPSITTGTLRPGQNVTAEHASGTSSTALIAGQTVPIAVVPGLPFTPFLEFDVDGVTLASSSNGSLNVLFTVPYGENSLAMMTTGRTVNGVQIDSEVQQIPVIPDPGRWIAGRVSDPSGQPVPGASITWQANGLTADFYASNHPFDKPPDMDRQPPARGSFVSALNFPNPSAVFGQDPIGAGLGANYAARFHGKILVEAAGEYQFLLRAHAGARLQIDGQTIAETAGATGEYADAAANATLSAGAHRIEVTYYESGGASTLQLFWTTPGGTQAVVPPSALVTDLQTVPAAITGSDGTFRLRVPAFLDGLQVELAAGAGTITLDVPASGATF
jgi:hypothetical protein